MIAYKIAAATVHAKPSNTTGTLANLAARIAPAIAASSNPPSAAKTAKAAKAAKELGGVKVTVEGKVAKARRGAVVDPMACTQAHEVAKAHAETMQQSK